MRVGIATPHPDTTMAQCGSLLNTYYFDLVLYPVYRWCCAMLFLKYEPRITHGTATTSPHAVEISVFGT